MTGETVSNGSTASSFIEKGEKKKDPAREENICPTVGVWRQTCSTLCQPPASQRLILSLVCHRRLARPEPPAVEFGRGLSGCNPRVQRDASTEVYRPMLLAVRRTSSANKNRARARETPNVQKVKGHGGNPVHAAEAR
jgi:hypothetical protein